ncbi:MAG TPA: amylo-alpha-1,6-glucosidase [Phycisphaerales bacterium]|nr:amylo-alpha-1,6-glucosidase [Phycisphaerales bacterium]
MDEVIHVGDRFYVLGSKLSDEPTLVLKEGDTFAIFGHSGDIDSRLQKSQGLVHAGMRHLSRYELRLNGLRPLLLGAGVSRDNTTALMDLTNPDIVEGGTVVLERGTLHIRRERVVLHDSMLDALTVSNYSLSPVTVHLTLTFECDFTDIFEVRGTARPRKGAIGEPGFHDTGVTHAYTGLDGRLRQSRVCCEPPADRVTAREMTFVAHLEPHAQRRWDVSVRCRPSAGAGPRFEEAYAGVQAEAEQFRAMADARSSDEHMDAWLQRSLADVRMLLAGTEHGLYPFAGVPWYSTVFGRDGIITAMQMLSLHPEIAAGVLRYLAALQADGYDSARDAEPGKILHERRTNEMALTGEVPFAQYYGSVDSTPLFVMLAGAYYQRTADRALIESIWPNIERALAWIDRDGDVDKDGLVEYAQRSKEGLSNQGWKDSHDAIFHEDGPFPPAPIALCEVQGYVFEAKRSAAMLARMMGNHTRAVELMQQADRLKAQFEAQFWVEELGTYAIALDGLKRPCRVASSNAGHCLWTGIADEARAARVRDQLMSPKMFTGWGIRTIVKGAARYNPMSYHNGSIWPHDNGIIGAGFARYEFRDAALALFRAWFEAASMIDLHRLPEVCCGFERRPGRGPTPYPVACSPQAWAAGSVFMLLEACLGLVVDGVHGLVRFDRPMLPACVEDLMLRNVRVGPHVADIRLRRNRGGVQVVVDRKAGNLDVVVRK